MGRAMNRFTYRWIERSKTLYLNRGTAALNGFEEQNSIFTPLVELINQLQPKYFVIHGYKLSSKTHWLICRALFHSNLPTLKIHLVYPQGWTASEDYFYPLSKTFREHLKCSSKKVQSGIIRYQFSIERSIAQFAKTIGFYVISNGKDISRLRDVLDSIHIPSSVSHEIVVVGPLSLLKEKALLEKCPGLEVISDESIYDSQEIRFPISKKKNLIFSKGSSEIIVILHDRIRLNQNWANQLLKKMRYFDIYSCVVRSIDGSLRYLDKFSMRYVSYIQNRQSHYYLTYKEDNSDQLIDGGFFVINRKSLGDRQFDQALHWTEMEDVDFVLSMKLSGSLITFDKDNFASSLSAGHFSLPRHSVFIKFFKIWIRRKSWAWDFVQVIRWLRWFKTRTALRQK